MTQPSSFGDLVCHYRLAAGLTQEALAERAGLSARAISDLERGTHRAPHRETVRLVADALGLDATARAALEAAIRRPRAAAPPQDRPGEVAASDAAPPASAARVQAIDTLHPAVDSTRRFVGREQELAALFRCLDAAQRGQGQLVLVGGEPGVGKTRLLAEFADGARAEGWQVLAGRAYDSEGMPPYLPFSEALRDYIRTASLADLRAQLDESGPDVALLAPDLHRRLADLPTRPPASPEEQRYRLFDSVCDFLLGIAGRSEARGLVLILDDLHWAEPSSLLLFQHLARRLSRTSASGGLLAAAYRSEAVSRSHPLATVLADLRRESIGERLALAPLPTAAIEALVRELAGVAPAAAVVQAVEQQTEGNPFFVGEVVRDLLANRRDLTAPATAALTMAVPEGAREVIDRRLARLTPRANRLLQVAAVLDDGVSFAELQAVAGEEDAGLLDALDESLAAGMLREAGERYQFGHALIRQTVHDGLSVARRQRLHLQVAQALEQVYAGNLGPQVAALAMHYRLAGGQGEKALAYLERAAERALASYAYEEAARHLKQALQVQEMLDPSDKAKRCDLLLALGDALLPAGEPLRAVETIAPEALRIAESLGDGERASRACQLALEGLFLHGGPYAEQATEFARWLRRADHYAPAGSLDRVRADLALAAREYYGNRQRAGFELGRRALALARMLDDDEGLFRAAELEMHIHLPEYQRERLLLAEELTRRPQGRASTHTFASFLGFSCQTFIAWGERERAEEVACQVKELASQTKDGFLQILSLGSDLLFMAIDGRLLEAARAGEKLRLRARELGTPGRGELDAFNFTHRALCYLGRADEALAAQPEAARTAALEGRSLNSAAHRAPCLAHLGRWEELHEAFGRLREYLGTADESTALSYVLITDYLEAAVLAGDADLAALLLPHLCGAAALISDIVLTCVARHLGAASALLGEREAARRYYEQALEVAGKVRFRSEIALTHLGIAELLLGAVGSGQSAVGPTPAPPTAYLPASGASALPPASPPPTASSRAEALAHLNVAIAELSEMKMQPALERALQLAERASKPGT